jgi:DNA invertase Pin-like site-specific DNA recombinase
MLDALEANGTRTVVVEDVTKFARKVVVQEVGIIALIKRGVTCWSARGEIELTSDEDEYKVAMRQIAAVFAELEKRRLVKKLKHARDRKKADTGKCGGRKSYAERDPDMVALAKKLARYTVNGRRRSLRDVAAELEAAGHTSNGKRYAATAVARMIAA